MTADVDDMQAQPAEAAELDTGPPPPSTANQPPRRPGCTIFGYVLIVAGLLLLCQNLAWIAWLDPSLWWPALLMAIGLTLIVRRLRR